MQYKEYCFRCFSRGYTIYSTSYIVSLAVLEARQYTISDAFLEDLQYTVHGILFQLLF